MSASKTSSPSCVLPATRIKASSGHADLAQQPAHVERTAFGEFGCVKLEVAHDPHRFRMAADLAQAPGVFFILAADAGERTEQRTEQPAKLL
jgi:hypothetical protein